MRRICLAAAVLGLPIHWVGSAQTQKVVKSTVPKTWDSAALATWHVPLAAPGAEPVALTADEFYRLPELKIYQSYPVYAPGKEPVGYIKQLEQVEPELVFDATRLTSGADWIRAGELVFDAPVTISGVPAASYIKDADWYRTRHVPVAKDGIVPFYRYVVREKGKVEIGTLSCGNCHTRVLPDGSVLKGAQGNFPRAPAVAYGMRKLRPVVGDAAGLITLRAVMAHDYGTPWLKDDLNNLSSEMSLDDLIAGYDSVPAGATPCHDSSLFSPVQVPSLIGCGKQEISGPHGSCSSAGHW